MTRRLLLSSLCTLAVRARSLTNVQNGPYSITVIQEGQTARASITGPEGTRVWTFPALDLLDRVLLSTEGNAAISGEITADPVLLGIRYRAGGSVNRCRPGQMLDDPSNKTGIGRLPVFPQDEFPESNPWRERATARPINRTLCPLLYGFDDEGRLHGFLRGFEHHWSGERLTTIRHIWKVR